MLLIPPILLESDSYDPFDPNGNITIKWDVMQLTDSGYVVCVCRHLHSVLILFSLFSAKIS